MSVSHLAVGAVNGQKGTYACSKDLSMGDRVP